MDCKPRIRTRKSSPKLAEDIFRYSPLKRGVVYVNNEDIPYSNYSKITNRLYLGNILASKDKKFFEEKKIKAVLNCTKDIPNTFDCKDVEYMRIPIDDSLKEIDFQKAYEFMKVASEFINKHVEIQKQNILVHCHAGRQRSVAMIVAYLIDKSNMDANTACKYVMDKRPEAFHFGLSLNFEKSIKKFEKDVNKCK